MKIVSFLLVLTFFFSQPLCPKKQKNLDNEAWMLHPQYKKFNPQVIAVVPMINMSLEEGVGETLQEEVYKRLHVKGYRRIEAGVVDKAMKKLGIQIAEQLAGISFKRLAKELKCDTIIQGQVNQAAGQHKGIYDAVVVSVSLQLIHCESNGVLWRCEQWRTAHRQWQGDPLNLIINFISHEKGSRKKRIAWLVQEMLRTLPEGPVKVSIGDNLLDKAIEVDTGKKKKKNKN